MKKPIVYLETEGRSVEYYSLLAWLVLFILAGFGSFVYIEHHGHIVTGMTNQIAWSGGHVFSVFLIAAAAGVFVVAAAGAAFGRALYRPLARLSGLLAIALLFGGLTVMMLDLGRPDRLTVAMTNFNFKSTLASNILRYNGFVGLVALFMWSLMDRRMSCFVKPLAVVTFLWSLTLSTGVGLEFAFLVAREAYDSAVMGPMMVSMSFTYGTAILILVVMASYAWSGRPLGDAVLKRLKGLLALFVGASLYFVFVFMLTTAYGTEHHGFVRFILVDGGGITSMFWIGQIFLGSVLPLMLLYYPPTGRSRPAIGLAAALVVTGGVCQMYVTLIGGQAYPLNLFPGMEVSSTFFDGAVNAYNPTLVELLLAVSCFAIALFIVVVVVKFLRILPESLADEVVDPHYRAPEEAE